MVRSVLETNCLINEDDADALIKMCTGSIDPEHLGTLLAMLEHAEPDTRYLALFALSKLDPVLRGQTVVAVAVARLIGDQSTKVRRQALLALAEFPADGFGSEVIDTLTALSKHPNPCVRGQAARAMGVSAHKLPPGISGHGMVAAILALLGDQSVTDIKTFAAAFLDYMGNGEEAGSKRESVRKVALEALFDLPSGILGPEVVPVFLDLLDDQSPRIRNLALPALSKLPHRILGPDVVPFIMRMADDPEPRVRAGVVPALSKLPPGLLTPTPNVVPRVLSLLGDESQYVRDETTRYMGKLPKDIFKAEHVDPLLVQFEDPDRQRRLSAVEGVAKLPHAVLGPRVVFALIALFGDQCINVHCAAAWALRQMPKGLLGEEVRDKLLNLCKHKDWDVRTHAIDSLPALPPPLLGPEVIAVLVESLKHPNDGTVEQALRALGQMPGDLMGPETFTAVQSLFQHKSSIVRELAVQILVTFPPWLLDSSVPVAILALKSHSVFCTRNTLLALDKLPRELLGPEVVATMKTRLQELIRYDDKDVSWAPSWLLTGSPGGPCS